MSAITPNFWFDGTAEEAAEFYVSLFPNSNVDGVHRAAGDNPSVDEGKPLVVYFTLDGRPYAGCIVNGQVDVWAQDNPEFGRRINAELTGVQFVRDGEAFSGGAPAKPDDFDDVADVGEEEDSLV